MGTDIEMYAEKRVNGVWEPCNDLDTVYDNDRNYVLFRILADVDRITNGGFESIAAPRGLPNDLSSEIRELADEEEEAGAYCHNHSWLLLRELLKFPWDKKKYTVTSFVNAEQYLIFKDKGKPEQFVSLPRCQTNTCQQNRSGLSILKILFSFLRKRSATEESLPPIVSHQEMEWLIQHNKLSSNPVTEISVEYPYADYCQTFLEDTVPLLKSFGEPNDVRIVFWFDS